MCKIALTEKKTEFIDLYSGKASMSEKHLSATKTAINPLIKDLDQLSLVRMSSVKRSVDEVDQHSGDSVKPQQKKKLIEHSGGKLTTNANETNNKIYFLKPNVIVNTSLAANIETIKMSKGVNTKVASGQLSNAHSFKTRPAISTCIDLTTAPSKVADVKTISTSSAAIINSTSSNGAIGRPTIQIVSDRLIRASNIPNPKVTPKNIQSCNTVAKNKFSLGPASIHQDFQSKFNQHIKQATELHDRNVKTIQTLELKQTTSNGTNNPPLTGNFLDKFISWNNSANCNLSKPPIYGKRRKQDSGDSSQKKNLICRHKDFLECFDEIINRTERPNFITLIDRKPHEYYSSEYKDLIRLAIQHENGQCDLITPLKIIETMLRADSFKPTQFSNGFNWSDYITRHNNRKKPGDFQPIIEAPLNLFNNPFPSSFNHFVVGHKLEAIDPQNCGLFCVCTVNEKIGFRIKLHFDGYHRAYDFWVNADSKDIFPAGWCNKTARELSSPHRRLIETRSAFDWSEYLTEVQALPAPTSCFPHLNTTVS